MAEDFGEFKYKSLVREILPNTKRTLELRKKQEEENARIALE